MCVRATRHLVTETRNSNKNHGKSLWSFKFEHSVYGYVTVILCYVMQIFYVNNITASLTRLFLYLELGKLSIVTRPRVGRLSSHGSNSGEGN